MSNALGIAAFPNLDVVRNPSLGQGVYAARYFIHYTVPLTADRVEEQPNPFYLQDSIPRQRIEFTMGKMSMVDFFDLNAVGSDSHLQFTNWAIDNNGAYDYAANTRGYTVAAMLSYAGPKFEVRYAEALMPTVANGIDLEADLRTARADNLELEWKPQWLGHSHPYWHGLDRPGAGCVFPGPETIAASIPTPGCRRERCADPPRGQCHWPRLASVLPHSGLRISARHN